MLRILTVLISIFVSIFADTLSLTTPIMQKNRSALSDMMVHIDSSVLKNAQTISVDLPQNITASFENSSFTFRKNGDFTWYGKSTNSSSGDYSLFSTKDGKTYGIIVYDGVKYILQNSSKDNYKIFKQRIKAKNHNDFLQLPKIKREHLKSTSLREKKLRSSSFSTVDVLVLYTKAYADYYGSGLSAKIQASIDYANQSLSNSDVLMNYRLVHQELFENADSNESVSISAALQRISAIDASNGQFLNISVNADVRKLRAKYHADLVTLFRLNTSGGTVGLGWIAYNNSKTYMRGTSFNVSEFDDITFAHESGHNLGCGHSRDIDNCNGAIFSYACGFDNGTTGTIMSYNQTPVSYFSNPNKTVNATVIGDSNTDCSRAINETRVSMENISNIDELNEATDSYSNGTITGYLNSNTDRDQYTIGLGGSTTIEMSSEYSNIAFYLNLYDENGYLIDSYMSTSKTITLNNGTYNLIISNTSDASGSTYSGTKNYTVNITTNYVKPANINITSIINYLLF